MRQESNRLVSGLPLLFTGRASTPAVKMSAHKLPATRALAHRFRVPIVSFGVDRVHPSVAPKARRAERAAPDAHGLAGTPATPVRELDEQLAAPFFRPDVVGLEVIVVKEVVRVVVTVSLLVGPVRVAVVFTDGIDSEATFADVLVNEPVLQHGQGRMSEYDDTYG